MAKALIRYWAYDNCLKNRTIRYTWKDLQAKANEDLEEKGFEPIGKTQFFKDINALKGTPYLAPIETFKENGQSYYRYADPQFSLRKQELNELEAQQIKSALMVLGRFKGLPQFDWVHEVIPKIEQNFGIGSDSSSIIGFEENVDLKGLEYFGELFNAILYKKVLDIEYQSFRSTEPQIFTVSPYHLKQYNGRWFLLGQNLKYPTLTTLSLDRIESIHQTPHPYTPNTTYDFNEYFEDIIGITKPENGVMVAVVLWFSPSQTPYIRTKPLHGTQKLRANVDGSTTLTIEVIPNFELEQLILSFGENCKVLEPQDLQERIKGRVLRMNDVYAGS